MNKSSGTMNGMIAAFMICIAAESIGPVTFRVMGAEIKLITMMWGIVLGILLSPDLLGKAVPVIRKWITQKEIARAPFLLSLTLYPLGILFGSSAGPNIGIVLQSGPALLLQEFGHIATMLIALPAAVMLGLGRSAVGGTFSLCRDTALGIIGDRYGLSSREGMGALGTYISGSVFGTLLFSILAPIGLFLGFHPFALGMASGMGSASMMGAATAALANAAPAYKDQILAYSATSGLITAVIGVYMELFIALPLANFYYRNVAPPLEKLRNAFK